MNTKLLREVQAHILEDPRRLDMTTWASRVDAQIPDNPICGTVACIAGWTVVLSGGKRFTNIEERAVRLLGLTYTQRLLFLVETWPRVHREAFNNASGNLKAQATVVANYIDAFIASYEDDIITERGG